MRTLADEPLGRVEWVEAETLTANRWNPNHVARPELRLLEHSIMTTGWMQPILVAREDRTIIDGFHRWLICRESKALNERYGGKLPVVFLDLDRREAMLLTVRINRAKGQHAATEMSTLIHSLHHDYGLTQEEIMAGIGASKKEVELLLMDGVFKARKIAEHVYSKAWYPVEAEVRPDGS